MQDGVRLMKNLQTLYLEKNKNLRTFILLAILLVVISLTGVLLGSVKIEIKDIINILLGKECDPTKEILIKTIRIPRVLAGLIAGAGLASAGVVLQGVMNNSLASPNTIGVNSGAGFAVMISMLVWPLNYKMVPVMAFIGALITTLIIYGLAYISDQSRTTIILAGITVSSFLSAGINTIKLLDTDITVNITTFLIGSLAGITMDKLVFPGLIVAISLLIVCVASKGLNILSLGDGVARSLGLRVNLVRFVLLVLSSALAGAVVSYAGLISFVGLIVPHICRRIVGTDHRILLPVSALLGASLVMACDIVGRVLAAPYELPVGIIMSFIGGPFFLYLLCRRKGGKRVNA